jgi:outer membrane lipoprotein-sorting protein
MCSGSLGTCLASAIAAVSLLLFAPISASQTGQTDHLFESIYKRGSQLNTQLKTLTARFTETTTSELLSRPLVATGTLAVERPLLVVLHYEQPERRHVLIEGDRLTVTWPGRHIREATSIATINRRIQRYFVDKTPTQLQDNFTITTEKAGDRPRTYKLTMLPKRKQIREGLTRLELWLDDSSLLLAAMRMTFPNGDTKLMVLDNIVANEPIDAEVFDAAR